MKKTILVLVALLPILTNSLFSMTITIINRSRTQCIPGCNTISREEISEYVYDDLGNVVDEYIKINISCKGTGISSCPNELVGPGDETELDLFTSTNGQLLFDHALNQISTGNLSGSYSSNYFNTTTGQLWKFTAIWSTANGIETISVTKELL